MQFMLGWEYSYSSILEAVSMANNTDLGVGTFEIGVKNYPEIGNAFLVVCDRDDKVQASFVLVKFDCQKIWRCVWTQGGNE